MPRKPRGPAFPDSPGRWLAWFRIRAHGNDGQRLAPGDVGKLLGVSEATVRRWEADTSRPRLNDLIHLSKIYGVTPLEEQFIVTAVTAGANELPPERQRFLKEATDALSVEFPACLMDSLFYIRAWNSYAVDLQRPSGVHAPDVHPLAWSLSPSQVELWDVAREAADHRGWRRVQEFWLLTAALCGTDAYRELINDLCRASPVFRARWLATDRAPPDLSRPIGTMSSIRDDVDMFRLVPLTVVLPPIYHLRLYVPGNPASEEALRRLKQEGPPTVHFHPTIHWSLATHSN